VESGHFEIAYYCSLKLQFDYLYNFLTDATGLEAWPDLHKEIMYYASGVTRIQELWFICCNLYECDTNCYEML